jgi:hypothetical protein
MTWILSLTGPYKIVNEALLREKSGRGDPRYIFYVAMRKHKTYEAYLAAVGRTLVEVQGRKGPFHGRGEILYCRRHGWIVDKNSNLNTTEQRRDVNWRKQISDPTSVK